MKSIPLPLLTQQTVEVFAPSETVAAETSAVGPSMQLFSDSASALASAEKPVGWLSDKLKHVQNHIHFFRQWVQLGLLKLSKVSGKINPANIGTKGFNSPQQFQDERALTMSSLPWLSWERFTVSLLSTAVTIVMLRIATRLLPYGMKS